MSELQYALLKSDNTIANIVVVDEDNQEILNDLIESHEASYSLNLEEVGNPSLITDTWNASTNSWDSVPVIFDINTIDWSTAIQKPE